MATFTAYNSNQLSIKSGHHYQQILPHILNQTTQNKTNNKKHMIRL